MYCRGHLKFNLFRYSEICVWAAMKRELFTEAFAMFVMFQLAFSVASLPIIFFVMIGKVSPSSRLVISS
ncbi:hypothetical protein YC2023_052172 [Brassica napus]